MTKETREADINLRAVYAEIHETRDPARMKIDDDTMALAVLMERRFQGLHQTIKNLSDELDRRSVIKKCPTAFAEGGERVSRFREPADFEFV